MFVVTGVTGHTGAATAEALRAAGHAVRVVVRRAEAGEGWRRKGCEVAVADLGDPAALAAALAGAEGAYLLTASLEQAGLPPEAARLFAEMYAGMASGLVAFERPEAVARGATPLLEALPALVV